MKIEEKIRNFIRSVHPSTWLYFIVSMIVYSPFMVRQLNNADCNTYGYLYHLDPGYGWENGQGRFLIRFFDMWRNGIVSPVIIVALTLVLLALTVEIITRMFEVKSQISALLIGALIFFSPSFADLFSYNYTLDSYAFSYLLCALCAYLMISKTGIKWRVIETALLFVSMGIYQAHAGFTLCLVMLWLLKECFEDKNERIKEPLLTTFLAYVIYAISTVMYLIVFKLLSATGYLRATSERGADNIFGNFISNLLLKIKEAYSSFFGYFFTNSIIYNSWFARKYINVILLLLTAILIAVLIIKKKIYKNIVKMTVIIADILLLPLIVFLITILAPGSSVHAETGLLLLSYINVVYVIPLILPVKEDKLTIPVKAVSCLLCVVLVVFIQVFARYIDRQQSQITNLANRLVYRMETLDGYQEGQKVLVVGRPHLGNYSLPDGTYETITQGMISHYTQIFGAEDQISEGWIQAFGYFTGVFYTECMPDERKQLIASDEVQGMGIYPAADSVKKINDIVVIKLSDWTPGNGR